MKPGIYKDLAFDAYLAIDAVSNTRLGQLARSPYHFQQNVGLDESAKYLVLGNLVHAGRLEILNLAERYAVMPDFHLDDENNTAAGEPSTSRQTKYVIEKVAEFERVNRDKRVVPRAWFEEMKLLCAALLQHESTQRLFMGRVETELTLIWRDPETDILCKGRMDARLIDELIFADLKTTADLDKFPKAIERYGYHRQLAHYRAGYAVLTGKLLEPWIVAVEKQAPYCVQAAPMGDEALACGERKRRELLRLLVKCRKDDYWPGPESPSCWTVSERELAGTEPARITIGGELVEV
jgi:hypothetical protein